MKKIAKVFVLLCSLSLFFSCSNSTQDSTQDDGQISVQDYLNTAEETADLSAYQVTQGSSLVLPKAITVTGGASQYDFNASTLTVKAAGAKITNLKNVAELVIDEAVGNGDVTVSNCDIKKITVKGGGANSIHIENTVVVSVSVAKDSVRIVLEGSTSVTTLEAKVPCILDSTSDSAKIANVTVDVSVKNIEVKGKTNVGKLVAASTEFKVKISSNDVKVEAAVVKTADGKTAAVTVEAAEGVTVKVIDVPKDEKVDVETEKKQEAVDDGKNVTVSVRIDGATGANQKNIIVTKVVDDYNNVKLVPEAGYTDYHWIFNGEEIRWYVNDEDNSLEINIYRLFNSYPGTYPIFLSAEKAGVLYGVTVYVTVQ